MKLDQITKDVPVEYLAGFVPDHKEVFKALKEGLAWERRDNTPRSEYYINRLGDIPYTYGKGLGQRQYFPKPSNVIIDNIFSWVNACADTTFDVCFLNLYLNQKDQLGWHADNSPEMDDSKPISVVSLGAEREIWFCPNTNTKEVTKQLLGTGSLLTMAPGMQDTHLHRIPKAGFTCGERISLTFRGM